MLTAAAEHVRANREALSKLDSHGGDGDHGTTMLRAMNALEKMIEASGSSDIKGLLYDAGWAVMGIDGGATGPLFGAFFMGMSEPAEGRDTLDADTLAAMFEAGLASVQKNTRAKVGDKTVIDALVPAVNAMRTASDEGRGVAEALALAAKAAEQGAASTRDLQARFGRAKNIGERSVGAQDPGAKSVSLIFRGFAEGLGGEV